MKFYTDYPIRVLGDAPNKAAPIREITLLGYDGDKYVVIKVGGYLIEIKSGYIYTTPRRLMDGTDSQRENERIIVNNAINQLPQPPDHGV